MNLLSSVAVVGDFIGRAATDAAKKVTSVANSEFAGEVARVRDALGTVRAAVSDATVQARSAAADAIAEGAAKAGIAAAARVGPQGNVYQRAVALFGTPDAKQRTLLIAGAVFVAVLVLVLLLRRK